MFLTDHIFGFASVYLKCWKFVLKVCMSLNFTVKEASFLLKEAYFFVQKI